jgi:hypothetical protein
VCHDGAVTRILSPLAAALISLLLQGPGPAHASKPVPWKASFCVVDGFLLNTDGHYHPVRRPKGDWLHPAKLEGKRIDLEGSLLPGDLFIPHRLRGQPVPCDAKLRRSLTFALAMAYRTRAEGLLSTGKKAEALRAIEQATRLAATDDDAARRARFACLFVMTRAEIREAKGDLGAALADVELGHRTGCDTWKSKAQLERLRAKLGR